MTNTDGSHLVKNRSSQAVLLLFIFTVIISYFMTGFYTIQPIGAIPKGVTLWVWRATDEPFFNSADSVCLRKTGQVSLLTRGIALSQAPKDRIILRLPYLEFAYLQSTNGQKFDR